MSKIVIPIIKFVFRGGLKSLDDALNLQPDYQIEEFSDANELLSFLPSKPACLVIVSLKDKSDLIQLVTFLKAGKKVIKESVIKVVVINFSGDKNYEKASEKLGIQDLVEPGINTKALKFKLDFWMKSLNAQIKNNPNNSSQQSIKSLESKSTDKKQTNGQEINWTEPLDLESDIWIIKNENDCKKVMSKWLIRLLGPSPYIGNWIEVKSGNWRFDIKDDQKDIFIGENGSWFFNGYQKPEFIWKENIWLITGDRFDLYFQEGTQVNFRLQAKDKNLTICKNSLFAKTKEPLIVESFDKNMIIKRKAENFADLAGTNQGERLDGHLAGEIEGGEIYSDKPLSQAIKTEKRSTYWSSRNTYQEEEYQNPDGPKADGPKEGANLEGDIGQSKHQKYYNTSRNQGDRPESGNLDGKTSTDKINNRYETKENKNEAEKSGNVIPFVSEQNKSPEEKILEELTEEAKVFALLIQDGKKYVCHLDDSFDDSIYFKTATTGINPLSEVKINIVSKFKGKSSKLEMIGVVQEVEEDGEGNYYVIVKIQSEDVFALDKFMIMYSVRQQNISEFLKMAKGL